MKEKLELLRCKAQELGASKIGIVDVADISVDACFRSMCESNACGNYGRNYTCPPDIGDIQTLMGELKSYRWALVYQTVGELEDSYDFEGMMDAGNRHNQLCQKLWDYADEVFVGSGLQVLHLGAGGCRLCERCGKLTGEPCRNPQRAIGSLEAYGINVSELAKLAGMKYINGRNTVTYFGAVFCK